MGLIDIIPIVQHGMSIITLIILSLSFVGTIAILKWLTKRLDNHDYKLEMHEKLFQEVREEFAGSKVQFEQLKGSIEKTQMVVDRIDCSLSDIAKTNVEVLKSYLTKDK